MNGEFSHMNNISQHILIPKQLQRSIASQKTDTVYHLSQNNTTVAE